METTPTGTQCLDRAVRLMKLLATRDRFGWGLTDLSRRSGIDKATVHRILGCLEAHRLVDRNVNEHRYFPGAMLVELGLSVLTHHSVLEQGHARVEKLVERTGAVAMFYLRSSSDSVVAAKFEQSVHRGMLHDVGCRRPLVMSAGGVAILCALAPTERAPIIEQNMEELRQMGIPHLERFQTVLDRSLELGYAANLEDVVSGINSFAVCIRDSLGRPFGSLALAGDTQTLPGNKAGKWAALLEGEARLLETDVSVRGGHHQDSAVTRRRTSEEVIHA